MTLTEFLTSVADAIRSRLPWYDKIKATDFPNMIDEVYSEGEMCGWSGGSDEATLKMWDAMTAKGKKEVGQRVFNETDFSEIEELPYPFKPKSTLSQMFYNYSGTVLPRKQYVDMSGVSTTDTFDRLFSYNTLVEYIPYYGWGAPVRYENTFTYCRKVKTIEKLPVNVNTLFNIGLGSFRYCDSLEDITFEGEIGQNVSFVSSPNLKTESLLNILTTLSKNSTYANGKALTLNTASRAVIEADTDCSQQLASAVDAGWTVAYA